MKDSEKIRVLEEELKASIRREELLTEKIEEILAQKKGWFKRKIDDEGSKIGMLLRSPRTIYRIIRYPETINQIREKRSAKGGRKQSEKKVLEFVPIDFVEGESDVLRVNFVAETLEKEALRMAIDLANRNGCELRVAIYGSRDGVREYKVLAEEKGFPLAERISFFNSVEQAERRLPFKMEVGKNEIFITRAWHREK